jgi:hypothetical protein
LFFDTHNRFLAYSRSVSSNEFACAHFCFTGLFWRVNIATPAGFSEQLCASQSAVAIVIRFACGLAYYMRQPVPDAYQHSLKPTNTESTFNSFAWPQPLPALNNACQCLFACDTKADRLGSILFTLKRWRDWALSVSHLFLLSQIVIQW